MQTTATSWARQEYTNMIKYTTWSTHIAVRDIWHSTHQNDWTQMQATYTQNITLAYNTVLQYNSRGQVRAQTTWTSDDTNDSPSEATSWAITYTYYAEVVIKGVIIKSLEYRHRHTTGKMHMIFIGNQYTTAAHSKVHSSRYYGHTTITAQHTCKIAQAGATKQTLSCGKV
jgi:hypothetical protein